MRDFIGGSDIYSGEEGFPFKANVRAILHKFDLVNSNFCAVLGKIKLAKTIVNIARMYANK